MKKNVGPTDKVLRLLMAVAIIALYLGNLISGTLAIVLLAVAIIFVVTAFLNFCPIYWSMGLSSRKKENQSS